AEETIGEWIRGVAQVPSFMRACPATSDIEQSLWKQSRIAEPASEAVNRVSLHLQRFVRAGAGIDIAEGTEGEIEALTRKRIGSYAVDIRCRSGALDTDDPGTPTQTFA